MNLEKHGNPEKERERERERKREREKEREKEKEKERKKERKKEDQFKFSSFDFRNIQDIVDQVMKSHCTL
jgi:negative regulator of genetic competence, sporulation and motility